MGIGISNGGYPTIGERSVIFMAVLYGVGLAARHSIVSEHFVGEAHLAQGSNSGSPVASGLEQETS